MGRMSCVVFEITDWVIESKRLIQFKRIICLMPITENPNLFTSQQTMSSLPSKTDLELRHSKPEQVERLSLNLNFSNYESNEGAQCRDAHQHVLFSPLHYEGGYAYPLIVWLHDQGADERQLMRVMPRISMRNYVAVAPQGLSVEPLQEQPETAASKSWNCLDVNSIMKNGCRQKQLYDWPNDEQACSETEQRVFDCISLAQQRNNINRTRIFIGGIGTGATAALRLGLLYPDSFAGIFSLFGPFPTGQRFLSRWTTARKLQIFMGVKEDDSAFSPTQAIQTMELFHTAGIQTTAKQYPSGDETNSPVLQDLNRWIMDIVCRR